MSKIILYHGTPNKIVTPKFGGGDEKHDYGKGFISPKVSSLQKNGQCADRLMQTAGYISMNLKPMD